MNEFTIYGMAVTDAYNIEFSAGSVGKRFFVEESRDVGMTPCQYEIIFEPSKRAELPTHKIKGAIVIVRGYMRVIDKSVRLFGKEVYVVNAEKAFWQEAKNDLERFANDNEELPK